MLRSMSRVTHIVLCIIGAVLLVVAAVDFYAAALVLQRDRFAALAVETMRTPDVTDQLAVVVVDRLDGRYGLTVLIERALAESAFADALRGPSGEPILKDVALSLREALLAPGGRDVVLVLDPRGGLVEDALSRFDLAPATVVPSSAEAEQLIVIGREGLPRLSALLGTMPWAGLAVLIVGALLVTVGVASARSRSAAMMGVGWGLASSGAVVVTGVVVAPTLVGGVISQGLQAEVARTAVSVAVRGLLVPGVAVFLVGVVVMMITGRRGGRPAGRDSRWTTSRRP